MMRFLWALVIVLVMVVPSTIAADTEQNRPNVLFIVVDDLNDWIQGLNGHPQTLTPNLARLAARGTMFTNAHCTYALCNPSRASVLTGMLPSTSGVFGNQQDWRKARPLRGKETLPEYFRKRGYWTGAAGKIYHANHGGQQGALGGGHGGRQGFHHPDSWEERYPSKEVQIPDLAVRTGQNFNGLDIWHWDWGPINQPDAATADGRCAGWVIEQLKRPHYKPFFLALGIYAPHGPWYCPKGYFDKHPLKGVKLPKLKADDLDDIPEIAKGHIRGKRSLHRLITEKNLYPDAVQAYLAQISFADATLGKVLDALDRSRYAKNTIICLWSDHGWYLGEKQRWHKGGLWEEATRVPLVFVVPGTTQPGSVCSRPVSLVDLYPTLVDLCRLPKRTDLDGQSLVSLLKDPKAPRRRPALTISGGGKQASYAIRDERWRYIRYSDGSEELYDHDKDPNEWTNLAKEPEHAELKKQLGKWIPRSFAWPSLTSKQLLHGDRLQQLVDGVLLPGAESPDLSNRSFQLIGTATPKVPDGVILSQGNSYSGWAVYLKDGQLCLTTRQRRKASTVAGNLPSLRTFSFAVDVDEDAIVTLQANGKTIATGKLPGLFRSKFRQGVSVGHPSGVLDNDIRVGAFRGNLFDLYLKWGDPKKSTPKKENGK